MRAGSLISKNVFLAALVVLALTLPRAQADDGGPASSTSPVAPPLVPVGPVQPTVTAPYFPEDSIQKMVRDVILAQLKERYEEKKNWGHTTRAMVGVKVRGNVLKPRLEKRVKDVNDGLWERYVITPIDPERNLQVRLENVHSPEAGHIAFTLFLQTNLHGEAHVERWRQGIKMLNFSTEGTALVSVRADCDLGIRFEKGAVLSDVVLEPKLKSIDLTLVDLDLKRISRIGGTPVHELGDWLRPRLARELDRREPKLVEKANASIAKRSDRLRLSLSEFLASGWDKFQSTVSTALTPAPEHP